MRDVAGGALRGAGAPTDPDLVQAIIDAMAAATTVVRASSTLRLASHRVKLDARSDDVDRLLGGDRRYA